MQATIYDIMLNPTRMRIIQLFATNRIMTANDVCKIISDIPRTTLYRHIHILVEANVLQVIEETRIRGSVERTLTLNSEELNKQNKVGNIPQNAFYFFMNTYAKFDKYFADTNGAAETNNIFFNNTVMMMTDLEFEQFLSDMQAVFLKYHVETAKGRKPRDISVISAPPSEDGHEE